MQTCLFSHLKWISSFPMFITHTFLFLIHSNAQHFLICRKEQLMIKLTVSKRLTWQFLPVQTSHWIKTCLAMVWKFFRCCYALSLTLAQAATQIMFVPRHNRNFMPKSCTFSLWISNSTSILWYNPVDCILHEFTINKRDHILQAAKSVLCFILICFLSQSP